MRFSFLTQALALVSCLFVGQLAHAGRCEEVKDRYAIRQSIKPLDQTNRELVLTDMQTLFGMVGNVKLAWLDFTRLQNEMLALELCVNVSNTPLVGSGSRQGSVYFVEEKVIIFNWAELLQHDSSIGSALNMVHEVLGALGYPDENYEITSYMYAKIHTKAEHFGRTNVRVMEMNVESMLMSTPRILTNKHFKDEGSGISGVGGGGDPEIAALKALGIAMLLASPEYFNAFSNAYAKKDLDSKAAAKFFMALQIESTAVNKNRPRMASGINPHLTFGVEGRKIILVVDAGEWERLIRQGHKAYDQRGVFMKDLVTAVVLMHLEGISQ